MAKDDITNFDDIIDVRDVIARVEYLEEELDDAIELLADHPAEPNTPARQTRLDAVETIKGEMKPFADLLEELSGNGGDEQWRDDWYPITLVRDSYFRDYAQELAEECCPWPPNSPEGKALQQWPYRCIDWDQAAKELQQDYSTVEFDGVTYWYR